jgi:hypothetical protein
MKILEKFYKQPADRQDYDIDYNDYLVSMGDTFASHTVVCDSGITFVTSTLSSGNVRVWEQGIQSLKPSIGFVKVWVQGGTAGENYKVTITLTTTAGRIKQAEIVIKVREV